MRLSIWFFLLTLVLNVTQAVSALAAPVVTHEIEPIEAMPKTRPKNQGEALPVDAAEKINIDKSTLQWDSVNPLTPEERQTVLNEPRGNDRLEYDKSFRIGYFSGVINENRDQKRVTFGAFRFDFNKKTFETWQGEIKFGTENFLHLTIGKKYPFLLEQIGAPYYRFAFGNILESREGLGSVLNFKKFQALAAIGLDDFFLLDYRVQMELATGVAIMGPQFEASLGFAF